MKHIAWVFSGFQTHSDWCRVGTDTVRGGLGEREGRMRSRSLGMRGGSGQDFSNSCRSETGANENFQPAQNLVHGQRKFGNPRSIWIRFLSKQTCNRPLQTDNVHNGSVMNESFMNESFMNVVFYERILFRTGLLWTGLLWTDLLGTWSVSSGLL